MSHYIAMWSGPRHFHGHDALWGNRPDTYVCDEPLYAHYLLATGHTDHPGYEATISEHETDWRKAVAWLTGSIPAGKSVFYQKHMAHHILPGMSTDWIERLTNCFLIREPSEMLSSLLEFLPAPTAEETGLPQQARMFDRMAHQTGSLPPVIDAKDLLTDAAHVLRKLCERVDVPFCEEMLHWPPGPRSTDGAWAPHWYAKVYETTSFGGYRPKNVRLPEHMRPVLDECRRLYDRLYRHRIRPSVDPPHLESRARIA